MDVIKIALVEDHRLYREGLCSQLMNYQLFDVILEADDGIDFIEQIDTANLPNVVIVDINMPRMDGMGLTRWLRANLSQIKVIILTMFDNEKLLLEMYRTGAQGYLMKDCTIHELTDAIAIVQKGEICYPLFARHIIAPNEIIKVQDFEFSSAELTFLKLLASELSFNEIALEMKVSLRIIERHRNKFFEKFQVKSRIGLVLFCVKNEIINIIDV
jgi:DNA-binding NarL/FixJ family response regulator